MLARACANDCRRYLGILENETSSRPADCDWGIFELIDALGRRSDGQLRVAAESAFASFDRRLHRHFLRRRIVHAHFQDRRFLRKSWKISTNSIEILGFYILFSLLLCFIALNH